jgi:biotin carboxyl carrier protein
MKAPKAGVVVSMNAEEGATVSAGDVLAVIE